jgi:hypothetical protein
VPRRKLDIISTSLLLLVAIVCLCGLLGAALGIRFNTPDILYLGQGRSIAFFDDWYEIDSCSRRFQIRDNFIRLAYRGCGVEFCDEPDHHEYKAIHAENGNLIGILDNAVGSPLLIMYDFSSGQCWPCQTSIEQRSILFDRLKKENPEVQKPDYWLH